ncbi:MAG: TonB-dependent receptor [Acidobacteriales bacterium]|nr:TonB-dependent receptor [Terriglobales bacterium]
MKTTSKWIGITLMLFVSCLQVFGQATASTAIRGTVLDSTGAAVVGADVTITNPATGFTRTVKTGSDGSYNVEPLQAGVYSVKVAMAGFAGATAQKVETLVGSSTTQNFSVKPGSASEVVEVTSEMPIVDQLKTSVSQNITPTEMAELPLLGRDAANLAYLVPGVKAADSYDPTKARSAVLSVNGQNGRNVNVTVNGVDNKDNTVGGTVMQLPLEAVQEFAISTQRFSAANGRSEGAAINMITKSGTNNIHGSAFAFFRDQMFNADQKLSDGTKANSPYDRQQFGGSIGGPFIKDKVFGFFALERLREHTSLVEDPTSFSELTLATPIGAQASAVIPTPFFETRLNGRADWLINNANSAYVSFSTQGNDGLNDQSDGTGDLTNGNFTVNHMQVGNFTLNSVLSPTTVNQFTLGFQYWNNLIASNISAPLVTFPDASFGTNTNVPQQSYQRKWQFKDDLSKTWGNHTFKGGFDYIWEPRLGGFFEFSSTLEIDFKANPSCILAAVSTATCGPAIYPNGFATPGAVNGMGIANGNPAFDLPGGAKQLGLYFQDDWKATKRLTLNLGLRWDRDFNLAGSAAVANSQTYKELKALNNPLTNPFVNPPSDDTKNFSPRVGFAYDLTGSGKQLLRGGFGIYYGNIFLNIPLFMVQQGNATIFQQSLSISGSDPVPGTAKTLLNWRYGVDPLPTIPAPSATLNPGSVGRVIDTNYVNPYTEQFNVGYSLQTSNTSVFELEYVHSLGLHENKTINIDQKVPGAGCTAASCPMTRPLTAAFNAAGLPVLNSVRVEESIGRSRYDGVNFSYRQRMAHHFSMNANYTLAWARGYGAGGTSFRNYPRNSYDPLGAAEFGPSPNDERHHVTISGIVDLGKGFQFSPILQFGSARPYDVVTSTNTLDTGGGNRPAVIVPASAPTNYLGALSGDAARFCYYVSKQCVLSQFDPLRGDAFFQLDTRLTKNFRFGDRMNFQMIAQAFNLTNRANYGNNFHGDIGSPSNFGTPAGFINPTSTNTPRSLTGEFGFRFTF